MRQSSQVGGVAGSIGAEDVRWKTVLTETSWIMPFLRSVDEVPHEKLPTLLIPRPRTYDLTLRIANLHLWCGGDHVRKEWITSNNEYSACDYNFEIRLCPRGAGKLPNFIGWHNVKVFRSR